MGGAGGSGLTQEEVEGMAKEGWTEEEINAAIDEANGGQGDNTENNTNNNTDRDNNSSDNDNNNDDEEEAKQAVDPEDPPDDGMAFGDSSSAPGGAGAQSKQDANAAFKEAESDRVWQEITSGERPATAKGYNPVVDPAAGNVSQGGGVSATEESGQPAANVGSGAGNVGSAVGGPSGGLLPQSNEDAAAKTPQLVMPKGFQVIDPPRE
jgi:hypothetical protein